jgi:hypothetical protein
MYSNNKSLANNKVLTAHSSKEAESSTIASLVCKGGAGIVKNLIVGGSIIGDISTNIIDTDLAVPLIIVPVNASELILGAADITTTIKGDVVSIGETTSETQVEDNLTVVGDLDVDGLTISLGAATSETQVEDNLTVVGDLDVDGTVISLGATISETTVEDNLTVDGNINAKGNVNLASDAGMTRIGSTNVLIITAVGWLMILNQTVQIQDVS